MTTKPRIPLWAVGWIFSWRSRPKLARWPLAADYDTTTRNHHPYTTLGPALAAGHCATHSSQSQAARTRMHTQSPPSGHQEHPPRPPPTPSRPAATEPTPRNRRICLRVGRGPHPVIAWRWTARTQGKTQPPPLWRAQPNTSTSRIPSAHPFFGATTRLSSPPPNPISPTHPVSSTTFPTTPALIHQRNAQTASNGHQHLPLPRYVQHDS